MTHKCPLCHIDSCFGISIRNIHLCVNGSRIEKNRKRKKVTHLINLAKLPDHTHFKPQVPQINPKTVRAQHDQSAPPLCPKQEVTRCQPPVV